MVKSLVTRNVANEKSKKQESEKQCWHKPNLSIYALFWIKPLEDLPNYALNNRLFLHLNLTPMWPWPFSADSRIFVATLLNICFRNGLKEILSVKKTNTNVELSMLVHTFQSNLQTSLLLKQKSDCTKQIHSTSSSLQSYESLNNIYVHNWNFQILHI